MTLVLEEHWRSPIDLHVMDYRQEGNAYTRKIFLTAAGPHSLENANEVELGVVRIRLDLLQPAVRDEILRRKSPLGAILVKHNVMRRIEPRWFVRLPARSELIGWFDQPAGSEAFGRVGVIHCDGEPAIDLLEIVTRW